MVGVVIVCRSVRRWVRGNVVWCVVRVVRTVVLVTVCMDQDLRIGEEQGVSDN